MFIRSNVLTTENIYTAFQLARAQDGQDIYLSAGVREFRPRRYRHGYQLYAEAVNGKHTSAHYDDRAGWYPRAASWDAYGYAMARLYAADPDAQISGYRNVADFCLQTARYIPRGMTAGFRRLLKACTP